MPSSSSRSKTVFSTSILSKTLRQRHTLPTPSGRIPPTPTRPDILPGGAPHPHHTPWQSRPDANPTHTMRLGISPGASPHPHQRARAFLYPYVNKFTIPYPSAFPVRRPMPLHLSHFKLAISPKATLRNHWLVPFLLYLSTYFLRL